MPELSFPARIDPEEPNSVCDAFTVTFRDLPECVHFGAGHHRAAEVAREVLEDAIKRRITTGQTIPTPSAPESGEIAVTVEVDQSA